MPVFRKVVDRLSAFFRRDGKVAYRTRFDAREAFYLGPMLDRITADDEDGETLRVFLIRSMQGERPPVEIYQTDRTVCRIDGPLQMTEGGSFPLGGLVLTTGVTAHLDPFEAKALHRKMEEAIEIAIQAWARDQDLYSLPEGSDAIDRGVADPAAKVMIAAWADQQRASIEGHEIEPVRPRERSLRDMLLPPCKLCGRRLAHA